MIAMNNQTGIPHSSTLRNPRWYTASVMMPSKKNQIMGASIQCEQQPTAVQHCMGKCNAVKL